MNDGVKKEQVDLKISPAHLYWIMAADETEVTAKFDQEVFKLGNQPVVQIGLGMGLGKVEKLDQVAVLEDGCGIGVNFSRRR
jgi:hypothetical protein